MTEKDFQDAMWIKKNLAKLNGDAPKAVARLLEILDGYAERELAHTGLIATLQQELHDSYSTIDAVLENAREYLDQKRRHIAVSLTDGSAETKSRVQTLSKTQGRAGLASTAEQGGHTNQRQQAHKNPGNVPPLTTG